MRCRRCIAIRHKLGLASLLASGGLALLILSPFQPYLAVAGVALLAAALVAKVVADMGNFADARAGVPAAGPGERLQVLYVAGTHNRGDQFVRRFASGSRCIYACRRNDGHGA